MAARLASRNATASREGGMMERSTNSERTRGVVTTGHAALRVREVGVATHGFIR